MGLWTMVVDFIAGPCLLKIKVPKSDVWSYAPTSQCGADGDATSLLLPERCLYDKGPVGALIAKIGGSSAGFKDDGTMMLIGKTAVVSITGAGGPLYLTINDEITGMWNNAGFVDAFIWRADLPVQPAAAGADPGQPVNDLGITG